MSTLYKESYGVHRWEEKIPWWCTLKNAESKWISFCSHLTLVRRKWCSKSFNPRQWQAYQVDSTHYDLRRLPDGTTCKSVTRLSWWVTLSGSDRVARFSTVIGTLRPGSPFSISPVAVGTAVIRSQNVTISTSTGVGAFSVGTNSEVKVARWFWHRCALINVNTCCSTTEFISRVTAAGINSCEKRNRMGPLRNAPQQSNWHNQIWFVMPSKGEPLSDLPFIICHTMTELRTTWIQATHFRWRTIRTEQWRYRE